jgi:uncharacterized protein (UPF0335 family)
MALDPFQIALSSVNLNDENSIVNLLTSWDKKLPSAPKDDILDGRRLCGDAHDISGKLLDGSSCADLLQQCLTTDGNDCIKKFNTLRWDQQINVDTMDYYVARNLAKHLGFYEQPVLDAVKAVTLNIGKPVNDNVLLLFNAIKEKINKVEKRIDNKFKIRIESVKIPTMSQRIPRVVIGMHGGGLTSYNDLIMNLDTLKNNLLMNGGGSDSSILIKTSLKQLIQLLEKEGKKIDDTDLARIHQYISSLERSEEKLKKVREYINVLIKAITENGYDIKKIPEVTLGFLKEFAEKESSLVNTTELKVQNLHGTFKIIVDSSGLKLF